MGLHVALLAGGRGTRSWPLSRPDRKLLRLPKRNVLVEPSGRNTAPAVALALLVASVRDPDAVVLALPSDHHVARPAKLRQALRTAAAAARSLRALVLLGIEPER